MSNSSNTSSNRSSRLAAPGNGEARRPRTPGCGGRLGWWLGIAMAIALGVAERGDAGGTVVVANDEWTLWNAGFNAQPITTAQFVANLCAEFSTNGTAHWLIPTACYSGSNSTSFRSAIEANGGTVTVDTTTPLTVEFLSQFDVVVLCGQRADNTWPDPEPLRAFIDSGGHAYLAGGTGPSGWDAAGWNAVLAPLGIQFSNPENGINGSIALIGDDPLFENTSPLYQINGNSLLVDPEAPGVSTIANAAGTILYAVSRRPRPCLADLNNDGVVDGADIAVLLGFWGLNGKPVDADLNGDGIVDGADLAVLLSAWGGCP